MSTIAIRLSGRTESIQGVLDTLRGTPGVEGVMELGVADTPRTSEDSSSAGLVDDTGTAGSDVEIEVESEAALPLVRDRIERAGREADIVVEWREPL